MSSSSDPPQSRHAPCASPSADPTQRRHVPRSAASFPRPSENPSLYPSPEFCPSFPSPGRSVSSGASTLPRCSRSRRARRLTHPLLVWPHGGSVYMQPPENSSVDASYRGR